LLTKLVSENRTYWDERLYTMLFSYKTPYKVTIGYTPYQLVYGLHPLMSTEYIVPMVGRNERNSVATPLWGKCEVATHTPKNGTWESFGTPEDSEHDCRGQNTLHQGVFYTVGKGLKCRYPKWPRMSHLDICSTSYGWKKGRESNWQFDSRSLKVRNRPDSGVCRWSEKHHWKALKESYNFSFDLVAIGGWSEKLWTPKVPRVLTGTISRLHFGSPRKKCHSDASATESHIEYYMGEGGDFPRVRAMVSQVSPRLPVACPNT
jgi:hypothetical protein